jgi:hypothetical protein
VAPPRTLDAPCDAGAVAASVLTADPGDTT